MPARTGTVRSGQAKSRIPATIDRTPPTTQSQPSARLAARSWVTPVMMKVTPKNTARRAGCRCCRSARTSRTGPRGSRAARHPQLLPFMVAADLTGRRRRVDADHPPRVVCGQDDGARAVGSPAEGEDRMPDRRQDHAMTPNVDGEGTPETPPSGRRARGGYGRGVSPFRPSSRRPILHRLVPVSQQLPGYRSGILRRDLLAGLTVAALTLPAAMAYAELAGLSPIAGLYAALLPTVAYTVLGSSRQIIVGPDGSIAALTATALLPLAADEPGRYASLAALLALLVGTCFLVARLVRLGWVADYFSRAVLIGYLHGVAVVLIIGQLAKLLGLDVDADNPLGQLAEVAREVSGLHGGTVAVGGVCL